MNHVIIKIRNARERLEEQKRRRTRVKNPWSQLENGTLLGQTAWSFTALLLCWFLGALLLLSRLHSLLGSFSYTSSRVLRLRLGSAMQSLASLGGGLVEGLALRLGNLEFESGGLAGPVGTLWGL